MVAIPAWTPDGVLPPIDPIAPTSAERAPYPVSLVEVIDRYSTSAPRMAILDGFLRFRAALHGNGFVDGFQWLDGSFMENIETLEGRAPQDVDVVSFLDAPRTLVNPTPAQQRVLDRNHAKTDFKVDSFLLELNFLGPRDLVFWSAYWYSVWAHRRDRTWKGYLQIELDPAEDPAARLLLDQNIATTAASTP